MLDLNDLATWRPRPQEPFSGHTLSCWRIARSDPVPFLDARTAAPALPGKAKLRFSNPMCCRVDPALFGFQATRNLWYRNVHAIGIMILIIMVYKSHQEAHSVSQDTPAS